MGTQRVRKIVDGPSEFDIMVSLFRQQSVRFTIEEVFPHQISKEIVLSGIIKGVERAGSNQSDAVWLIKFWDIHSPVDHVIRIVFDSRKRKGNFASDD